MKAYLLAGLLLIGLPVLGQSSANGGEVATGTIAALDAKNGFRSYRLGTLKSELPGLKEKSKGVFVAPSEPLKVGEAKLMGLYFGFHDEKLASIIMGAFGAENSQKLLDALRAQYGQGEQVSGSQVVWRGQAVIMSFEMKETYPTYPGRYGVLKPSKSCTVSIFSNEALAKEKWAKEAAAQKAAGDL